MCLSVCYRSNGRCGYLTSETKVSMESARRNEQNKQEFCLKCCSLTVMTVFSSTQIFTCLQLVTIAVTRLLVCLAISTTTNQAAQTQLRSHCVASFPGFPSSFPSLAVREKRKRRKAGREAWERG